MTRERFRFAQFVLGFLDPMTLDRLRTRCNFTKVDVHTLLTDVERLCGRDLDPRQIKPVLVCYCECHRIDPDQVQAFAPVRAHQPHVAPFSFGDADKHQPARVVHCRPVADRYFRAFALAQVGHQGR